MVSKFPRKQQSQQLDHSPIQKSFHGCQKKKKKKKKSAFFSAARISTTLQAGQGGPLIKKHTYKIFIDER